jgi:hypothetical protein
MAAARRTRETDEAILTIYPTFNYQAPGEIPTLTLMVANKSGESIDFLPETMQASIDNQPCHIYTLQKRVGEIQSAKRRKEMARAIAGGIAAGAAGYAVSHSTATYNNSAEDAGVGSHPTGIRWRSA